jgi:hypothetical protein
MAHAAVDSLVSFTRQGRAHNTKDEPGKVYVFITRILTKNGARFHVKGNITRSFTLADAKVSEVAQTVERALFPKSR